MNATLELEGIDDLDIFVKQIALARKKLKQPRVDFAGRLTAVNVADTMRGSSTLTLTIIDENYDLLDSGFFDCRDDGKLDRIEINYPEGSEDWWILTSLDPNARGIYTATLMERIAVEMQDKLGPYKASRGKVTRAQFLATLVRRADKSAVFHSKELTKKQNQAKKPKEEKRKDKDGGLHGDEAKDLKIGGAAASKSQLKQAERSLDVATEENASDRAVEAMVCAAIGESGFKAIMNRGGSPYGGVFQGNVRNGTFKLDDTEGMAKCFLKGGKGFQGGGAIKVAQDHPDWGPGLIAVTVEGSRSNFGSDDAAEHHYGQWQDEAKDIIAAYGGGGFGGASFTQQYNFQIGSESNPHENFWDGSNRLAAEVNWPFFIDGKDVYFDSEMTLIQQMPAAVIHRDDPQLVDWDGTWDDRQIATEMRVTLICDPFEFRAGEVFKMVGFGPYSTGSTAKQMVGNKWMPKFRPGYWLIDSFDRDLANLATDFTLKQPSLPKREPRGTSSQRRTGEETSGDLMAIMEKMSRLTPGYSWGGNHGPPFSSMKPSDGFDCSSSCSYALHEANMWPSSGGNTAQVSGWFAANYGKAGKGSDFTIWANAGHVWMGSEPLTGKDAWRFDTGGPGGGNGPKLHKGASANRPTDGFTPRHWSGS